MHSSVLRFCTLEPYVPLRNAIKRERLLFRSIGDIATIVTYMAVNSNSLYLNDTLSIQFSFTRMFSYGRITAVSSTDDRAYL